VDTTYILPNRNKQKDKTIDKLNYVGLQPKRNLKRNIF